MDGLEVTITNYSSVQWSRNNYSAGAGEGDINWTNEVTQVPSEIIQANSGQTTFAASSVHATWFAENMLWIIVGYGCAAGNFAVRLQQHAHFLGFGSQSSWSWWQDDTKSWSDDTTDATPQHWTFGDHSVVATPTLSDACGSVEVVISDM